MHKSHPDGVVQCTVFGGWQDGETKKCTEAAWLGDEWRQPVRVANSENDPEIDPY